MWFLLNYRKFFNRKAIGVIIHGYVVSLKHRTPFIGAAFLSGA